MRKRERHPMRAIVVVLAEYRAALRKRQAPARPADGRVQRGQDELALDALTIRSNRAREVYGNASPCSTH
jgi:hypothetical protein